MAIRLGKSLIAGEMPRNQDTRDNLSVNGTIPSDIVSEDQGRDHDGATVIRDLNT